MRDFKTLNIWQLARKCTLDIYRVSESFPPSERYGLQSQLRRAAVSAAANIAEGCGHGSQRELKRFVRIARGSASEVESHLMLAEDLKLIDGEESRSLLEEVRRLQKMLVAFLESIGSHPDTKARNLEPRA